MRIRILLIPENDPASLPLDNHPLASLIYRSVALISPDHANFLHSQGYAAHRTNLLLNGPRTGNEREVSEQQVASASKRFKLFVFSRPHVPNAHIKAGRLYFHGRFVEWQVSSPINIFIEHLAQGLRSQKLISIGDDLGVTRFTVDSIEQIEPPRFSSRMRFTALSPLTVAVDEPDPRGERRKHYVRADDSRFGALVVSNLLEKYRVLTDCEPADANLTFNFDWDYIRSRGGAERVSKLVQYKGTNIKCYPVPFFISGNPELIRLGWECGFGAANSQGFGMAQADTRMYPR